MRRHAGRLPLMALTLLLAACGDDDDADPDEMAEVAPVEDEVGVGLAPAEEEPVAGFGTIGEVEFAEAIWVALETNGLVGADATYGPFTEGQEPHGFVLDTVVSEIPVRGTIAAVVLKRNYGPEGTTVDEVAVDPITFLEAITVMYNRPGFNSDTGDWFWVKYLPDGTLDLAGETAMAGNVAGCIDCHGGAPGGDWVFFGDPELPEARLSNPGPENLLADPDACLPGDNDCTFGG